MGWVVDIKLRVPVRDMISRQELEWVVDIKLSLQVRDMVCQAVGSEVSCGFKKSEVGCSFKKRDILNSKRIFPN